MKVNEKLLISYESNRRKICDVTMDARLEKFSQSNATLAMCEIRCAIQSWLEFSGCTFCQSHSKTDNKGFSRAGMRKKF